MKSFILLCRGIRESYSLAPPSSPLYSLEDNAYVSGIVCILKSGRIDALDSLRKSPTKFISAIPSRLLRIKASLTGISLHNFSFTAVNLFGNFFDIELSSLNYMMDEDERVLSLIPRCCTETEKCLNILIQKINYSGDSKKDAAGIIT